MCDSFNAMEFINAAIDHARDHIWLSIGIGFFSLLVSMIFYKAVRNRRPKRLLRSRREQDRFSPLTTIYTPKKYRRDRTKIK